MPWQKKNTDTATRICSLEYGGIFSVVKIVVVKRQR
jgi:hypothetical protein